MRKKQPKEGKTADGRRIHYSVGAIIERDKKFFLIDRKKPPFGFAGPAGHIDEGETARQALEREVLEETGLVVRMPKLIFEEEVPWNICSRGIQGHYWYVYRVTADGEAELLREEANSVGWFSRKEMKDIKLEPVWEYWFKKLKIL